MNHCIYKILYVEAGRFSNWIGESNWIIENVPIKAEPACKANRAF